MHTSEKLYQEAIEYIPGGVNSPVRAFGSVGREYPVFIKRASGSHLMDEEDKDYVDYIGSWGPMILGHNHKATTKAVAEMLTKGSSFGLPTRGEVELAKMIVDMVPSVEKVRLTTSGTEATMSAIRLARAYTKRNKILKFEGCYHGHSDSLLVKAGSGLLTSGHQDSNGITEGTVKDTYVLPFGDLEKVRELLKEKDFACIIMEPIPANMGLILPDKAYLKGIREVCTEVGTVLIFDEVISGFRVAAGGAQEYYGIKPDLTTMGKIIGGGFPVGAFGGKKEIMNMLAPIGDVYHAGTLSGNPISVCAGKSILGELKDYPEIYDELDQVTKTLVASIEELGERYDVPLCINQLGSLFTIFFVENKGEKVESLEDVMATKTEHYNKYFDIMLNEGIMVPPSKFEAHFVSYAHNQEDFNKTLKGVEKAFKAIQQGDR